MPVSIETLIENKIITNQQLDELKQQKNGQFTINELVEKTNIFIELIANGAIKTEDIEKLSVYKILILCDLINKYPVIPSLLENKKIKLEQLLERLTFITAHEALLILNNKMIQDLLNNGIIKFDQIFMLSSAQVRVLTQKAEIIGFIQDKKITFEQILEFKTFQMDSLFDREIWDLVSDDKINLKQIKELKSFNARLLKDPIIRCLLKTNLINFESILKFCNTEQVEALKNQEILKLLTANKIATNGIIRPNSYQIEAIADPKILNFFKNEKDEINYDQLAKVNNAFQIDIIKITHIQTLLKESEYGLF